MAEVNFSKERSIKYLGREFSSLKRDLIKFTQAHHSGVFNDFNESSPGMALLEHAAYVGDVLSFYQDMNFNEIREETARLIENAAGFAKMRGYKPHGKRAARGEQAFFIEVPAVNRDGEIVPDESYCPILRTGCQVDGPNGVVFETLEDIHFSASNVDSPRLVTGSRFDDETGQPTHFAIRKSVGITAGETKTETFTLGTFIQFRTLELPDEDILEVLEVIDSDDNEWYQVDYLAQDTVYDYITNDDTDNSVVPYVLKLRSVPRRFVVDFDPKLNKTSLIFGSGDGMNFDDELVPNLADLALPLPGRRTFSSFTLDPQNFLKTRSLGMSPFDTTLTVKYRVGGGSQTNVPPGSIKSVRNATLDFTTTNLDPVRRGDVLGSLETINVDKTDLGGDQESVAEIKANSAAFFAAQNRVVSISDYVVRVLSLPSKFGKPEKVHVRRDNLNANAVNIHVLTKDQDNHLTQATPALLKNISTYLSPVRMLATGVNILMTDIINFRVEFGVVVSPKLNRTEVLTKCLNVVKDYFDLDNIQIGSPIILSDLQSEIQQVFGVISVYKLNIKNVFGRQDGSDYSTTSFDFTSNTSNSIIYCPQNAIFELKYPNRDIIGESK